MAAKQEIHSTPTGYRRNRNKTLLSVKSQWVNILLIVPWVLYLDFFCIHLLCRVRKRTPVIFSNIRTFVVLRTATLLMDAGRQPKKTLLRKMGRPLEFFTGWIFSYKKRIIFFEKTDKSFRKHGQPFRKDCPRGGVLCSPNIYLLLLQKTNRFCFDSLLQTMQQQKKLKAVRKEATEQAQRMVERAEKKHAKALQQQQRNPVQDFVRANPLYDRFHIKPTDGKMEMDPTMTLMLETFAACFIECVTKDLVWFAYKESALAESCVVCNLPLKTGDKCRKSSCVHNYHADCIVRYMERVEAVCPACKTDT